jgi:hypothetical protein
MQGSSITITNQVIVDWQPVQVCSFDAAGSREKWQLGIGTAVVIICAVLPQGHLDGDNHPSMLAVEVMRFCECPHYYYRDKSNSNLHGTHSI